MVVGELVNDFEKGLECLGVAVRQVGILEDVAEQERDAGILRHFGNAFAIKSKHLMATDRGSHEFSPAVTGKFFGEEFSLAAHFL